MVSLDGTACRAAAVVALMFIAGPAATQRPGPAALAGLEPGLWQVRMLGAAQVQPQSICVGDPAVLLQVQHRNAPCSRLVLANAAQATTVHYTCAASGFGRTSLRVETPRLATIDTQGMIDRAPFAYRAEARRVGACGAAGPAGRGARR